MKARIPKHREYIIQFPQEMAQATQDEAWGKLTQILEDYKKAHNGNSVYEPTFIEDTKDQVEALKAEYGFEYSIEETYSLRCIQTACQPPILQAAARRLFCLAALDRCSGIF